VEQLRIVAQKLKPLRRSPDGVLDWALAESPDRRPAPPPEWAATVDHLASLALSPVPPPPWWKAGARFRASLETWTDPTSHSNNDEASQRGVAGSIVLQLTLAGWGCLCLQGQEPQKIGPGKGFWAGKPFGSSHYLPPESSGWTFARIEVHHPYLRSRLARQVRAAGRLVDVHPGDALTASLIRLVRGAICRDFKDQFEAELALFEFVLTFERWTRRMANGAREEERLVDDVRSHILATLPQTLGAAALAAKFGMSRGHFSYFFRKRTGMTPSHFATQVRIQAVEKMLLSTREPLKTLAGACGFANANHLCKVFRRFRHITPIAFRQALR
jgi:AraC-like DNA-binding protein